MPEWDPTQNYAFIDNDTGVLQAWGYAESNCRLLQPQCDRAIPVAWDFMLEPGKWRYDETVTPPEWVAYP
ncbi:hypothetical protein [Herbaspirillum huttiense]|nr:hypothetical protein [Herbaspirillum huttiense]MEE1637151.1 hypothetical protein [Herbaspirillum huttiense NC40101]